MSPFNFTDFSSDRVVMLNNWMGYLLRAFPNLPPEAQDLILIFLGLKNGVHAGETEVTIFQNTTLQNMYVTSYDMNIVSLEEFLLTQETEYGSTYTLNSYLLMLPSYTD